MYPFYTRYSNMKNSLIVFFCCIAIHASGQSFYFPKEYYSDSAAMHKNIPELARKILPLYKEPGKISYLNNLFRLQIAAEQYELVDSTLVEYRKINTGKNPAPNNEIGFQFQTFACAQATAQEKNISFSAAFTECFEKLFARLSETGVPLALAYFDADVKSQYETLKRQLNKISGKDSIYLYEAQSICIAYASYNACRQIVPLAKPLIHNIENKQLIIEDSVLISMRDGATISATIVRKKDVVTPQPVVLVFNIYSGPADKRLAKDAVANGYIGITANTRGKRRSPQITEPFEHDANDAYDIINWISKQPWSNGKVGMYGGSYLGFSQWAAVKKVHPALKTIVPQVAVGVGIDFPMQYNVFSSYMLQWIHYVTNNKETDIAEFNDAAYWSGVFRKWYKSGKSFRSLDSVEGRPNTIFQRWLSHPSHDAFWQNMVAAKTDFTRINIPVLTTTGYFDADQLGAMYYFKEHHRYNKQANHYLLIGPYNHAGGQGNFSSELSGYPLDSAAHISISKLTWQWFNYTLKDSSRPSLLKDKINYQVMGADKWKHTATLEKMNNDTLTFYLNETQIEKKYRLSAQTSPAPKTITQKIDFADRSDSVRMAGGHYTRMLDLTNAVCFVSDSVKTPFEMNGSFFGTLVTEINKKDMDVSVILYELMPDQRYFYLGSLLLRASYAKNREHRQLLQPGKQETIPLNNAFFTSRRIQTGSKLVMVLSINKSPNWQINYGTGKDVSDETIEDAKEPLQVKWFTNSYIKIPVWMN